jgi:hypothetical protein
VEAKGRELRGVLRPTGKANSPDAPQIGKRRFSRMLQPVAISSLTAPSGLRLM